MAQACVLSSVQRKMEGTTEQQQQCMLTPAQPTSPDPSFITSSVRKRKEPREGDQQAHLEKRVRVEAAPPLPMDLPVERKAAAEQPCQCPNDGEGGSADGEGILFSPSFHLIDKEGAEAVAPSRPSTPPGDNASTDASTGTSASLDQGESSGVAATVRAPSAAAAAAAHIPTSPGAMASPAAVAANQAAAAAVEEEEEDEEWEFDPFLFIKRLPALEKCISPRTSFLLPRQTRHSKRKTLVLDLDETLVHSTLDGDCTPDFTFAVQMGPARHMVAVRMRPHLHTFLNRVAELFEVVVFTASQQIYAEQLLDIIDPGQKRIKHRIYRDSCVLWEGNYLKDLTVLGRDLAHTLIVDNSPQAFGFQLENGVPIESWYDDDEDTELLKLIPFLEQVAAAADVRPHIEQTFRLKELVDAAPLPPAISPEAGQ